MIERIKNGIEDSIKVKQDILSSPEKIEAISLMAEAIIKAYKQNKKVILMGNGGSASDAQHICAEFVGRFIKERKALPAIALNTNTSNITAIANDYGYDNCFVRQLEAFCDKGDVVIGLSTSGISSNVNKALKYAKDNGAITIGLLGKSGGDAINYCDLSVVVKSSLSARIQESHIMIGHIICELVEDELFK